MSQNKAFDKYIKSEKGKAAVASSRAKNMVKVTFELRKSTDKDILRILPATGRPAFIRAAIRAAYPITSNLEACAFIISRVLGIQAPEIVFGSNDDMLTETSAAKAVISSEKAVVYINLNRTDEPYDFYLLHELRHIYQHQYFSSHDDKLAALWRSEFDTPAPKNLRDYNLRDIELDANAFSVAMFFKPREWNETRIYGFIDYLFYMLDDNIKTKIFTRAMAFLKVK